MGFLDEIFDALLTSDPGARSALRQTRELDEEVAGLKRQVTALQRTVATLAAIIEEEGLGGGSATVRRRITKATRAHLTHDLDDLTEPDAGARLATGSPYRDALPVPTGSHACAGCGAAIGRDDPELTLGTRGRVCVACFQRGG